MFRIIALTFLFSLSCVLSQNVYVVDSMLFVNGQQFIVKGLDYSPAPIGMEAMVGSTGYGGNGFCSAKLTPWGEWKSACYDSDFFDGSPDIDPTRFPTGFLPIWQRDFPHIVATGANTIRLYNANPSTRVATQTYTNLFPYATGKDHTQFMKFCEDNGIYVIFPLFSDEDNFMSLDEPTYRRYLRWQIDEVGNSSSLLMWQLGNEMAWTWNSKQWNNATLFARFNRYADYVRRYTLTKWNRIIPVSTAVENQQGYYNYEMQNFHVDVFSANVFGTSFGSLFSGTSSFSGFSKLTCQYNKPLLITEFGSTYVNGQPYPSGSINQIWYNILQNIQNGLIGGMYFEQTDEPVFGKNFGLYGVSLAVGSDGKNSNQSDVFLADNVTPKQQYTDITTGTYNNKAYNFHSDPFTLLGHSPVSLGSATDRCSSSTYKACPGNGNPKCSGNGVCDRNTGTCTCASGWSGTDCSTPVCPGSPQCSGRGVCSTLITPPECLCNAGYFGTTCQSLVSQVASGTCPGGCSNGNGVCNTTTSVCACWPGWTGTDCAVTFIERVSPTFTSISTSTVASTTSHASSSTSTHATSSTRSSSTSHATSITHATTTTHATSHISSSSHGATVSTSRHSHG